MRYGASAAVLLAGLALAAGAQAQLIDDHESGLYVGGGGQFDVEIDNFDDVDETIDRYDSDDTAWKAFAGWRGESMARARARLRQSRQPGR